MSRGMKYRKEEVLDGIINNYDTNEVDLSSENENEDDSWSQTGQYQVILTIWGPSHPLEKGWKELHNRCDKKTKCHSPTPCKLDKNNGIGAVGGLKGNIIVLRITISLTCY